MSYFKVLLSYQIILFLFFSIILPKNNIHAQPNKKTKDSLFGAQLSIKAQSIATEVEKIYDKKIQIEWIYDKDPMGQPAYSKVDKDGTPIIYIKPNYSQNLGVIIHELYHFIQRVEGYPIIDWIVPLGMNTKVNRDAFEELTLQLHNPILHYIFYDTLRSWGINPAEDVEIHLRQFLNDSSLANVFTNMDNKAVALFYFKIKLEFIDSVLMKSIVNLLEFKNKQDGIILGKSLSQVVLNAKPKSPEEEIDALITCLNIFYEGYFHFKQQPWSYRQFGKHTERVAKIELKLL